MNEILSSPFHLIRDLARQVACICVVLVTASGCKESVKEEAASDPPDAQARESKQTSEQAMDRHRKGPFSIFMGGGWEWVTPIIEDQVLERAKGAVSIRFRLKNSGTETISFTSFQPYFVAGTFHSHPSGDPYTIEGDDRSIAIWFYPGHHRESPSVNEIAAGEEQSFVAKVDVPGDMPNPVEVSVCLQGPFVEANETLGTPRKLRWVEKTIP